MVKIAFVNFDMSVRGGAQQVIHNLVNALGEDSSSGAPEYELHVISLIHENGRCAYELGEGVRYFYVLPCKGRLREVILKGGRAFRRYCQEQEIQLVFYVGVYAGLCCGLFGRHLDIPRVFCDHGAIMSQWGDRKVRLMRRVGSRFSDQTVVLTKQSERAYYEKFSYEPGRVITIYNWLDDTILKHAGSYDADSNRLLTAGRFAGEKGMDLLVDTAVRLRERTADFVWDVYGDGELFGEIRERVEREGLGSHVRLLGLTDEMEKCYRGHAMYVLTSYREGLPLALIEAKANHLPLVSFDIVSGPAEIITDGRDGVLVPPYDTECMAERICELLCDRDRRVAYSEHSDLNIEKFSKGKILAQWKSLIERMTN